MAKKVFLAGLFHETHSFVEARTGLADFTIQRGDELLSCEGDASPLGGFLDFAREAGWEIIPGADYRAMPGGLVTDEVVESFRKDVESAWEEGMDAVYLVLHGAMSTEAEPDVEGEFLAWLRALPGAAELPVFGVYDLHANFSPAMARHADALLAYRENPHTDARRAAVRAAELLQRCLESGDRPVMTHRRPGLIWAPDRTGTAVDPMYTLEAAARTAEGKHGDAVWAVNIAAGFAYGDTPDTGVSFQVIGTVDGATRKSILDDLEKIARTLDATSPMPTLETPEEAIRPIIEGTTSGLSVLVEPSDNIGGGAPGDATGLLRCLVEHQVSNAAVCLCDPESVQALASTQPGDSLQLELGGKGSCLDPGPLRLRVELVSKGDGNFELEDRNSHLASVSGSRFDMGPTAVVRHQGITILLTSNRTPPFDLGQWRSQDLEPKDFAAIVVKAAVAHRRVYDPIAARMVWVDTPGPCTNRLETLPYRHARLPQAP